MFKESVFELDYFRKSTTLSARNYSDSTKGGTIEKYQRPDLRRTIIKERVYQQERRDVKMK